MENNIEIEFWMHFIYVALFSTFLFEAFEIPRMPEIR